MGRRQPSLPPNVGYQPSAQRITQMLDATTPAEQLRQWGERAFLGVQRYVAQNPNIPAETLWTLAPLFPAEVLPNPVLPLLWLESPDLPERLDIVIIEALTRFPEQCPSAMLRRLQQMTREECCAVLDAWATQCRDESPIEAEIYDHIRLQIQWQPSLFAWPILVKMYLHDVPHFKRFAAPQSQPMVEQAMDRIHLLIARVTSAEASDTLD